MTNYDYNYLTRLCDELPDEIFDEVCYELFDEVFDELCCKRCEEIGAKWLYELWKIGLKNAALGLRPRAAFSTPQSQFA